MEDIVQIVRQAFRLPIEIKEHADEGQTNNGGQLSTPLGQAR
jgi:hypothetical protein